MTDWMEIDARLTALEAQVDTLRRHHVLDELVQQGQAMGAYEPEPTTVEAYDCPHWQPEQEQRAQIDEEQRHVCYTFGTNGEVTMYLQPRDKQEQEGWDWIDGTGLTFNGITQDIEIATLLNKAGITPDTSDDDLAAMARLGRMRERALELCREHECETDDGQWMVSKAMYKWMRDLLLGETP